MISRSSFALRILATPTQMSIIRITANTPSLWPKTQPIFRVEIKRQKPSRISEHPFKILSRTRTSSKNTSPKTKSIKLKAALIVPKIIVLDLVTVANARNHGDHTREIAVVAGKAAEIKSGAKQRALLIIIRGKSNIGTDPRRGGGAAQGRELDGKGPPSSSLDRLNRGTARRGGEGCIVIGWSRGVSE